MFLGGIDVELPPYIVGRVGEGFGLGLKTIWLYEVAAQQPHLSRSSQTLLPIPAATVLSRAELF